VLHPQLVLPQASGRASKGLPSNTGTQQRCHQDSERFPWWSGQADRKSQEGISAEQFDVLRSCGQNPGNVQASRGRGGRRREARGSNAGHEQSRHQDPEGMAGVSMSQKIPGASQGVLRHTKQVITLQRYVRGYVVRLRMWRNAIRAEDELWGAVEIQRCWRGYLGRLRWELEYESVWSRDNAVARMQRYMRGWLARTAVQRKRKRLARQEFEKARRRFKSAQKIQALARGVLCRQRMLALRYRKVKAANTIQRVFRGHRLRCWNFDQIYLRKTVKCQSAIRTYLVRCRRFNLIAKMIMIQRNWRRWHRYIPEAERNRRLSRRLRNREAKAESAEADAGAVQNP